MVHTLTYTCTPTRLRMCYIHFKREILIILTLFTLELLESPEHLMSDILCALFSWMVWFEKCNQ